MSDVDNVVPLSRTRCQLAGFAVSTLVAVVTGLPGWTVVALGVTTVGIPVAVLLVGGVPLLRDLLRIEATAIRRRPRAGAGAGRGRHPLVRTAAPATAEPRGLPRWPSSAGGR